MAKQKKKMNNFLGYLILSLVGVGVCIFASIIGLPFGIFIAIIGGMMMLVPMIQVFNTLKLRGLLPLFDNLPLTQKLLLLIDSVNHIHFIVADHKNEGILQKKGIGMIEDKGTPLYWGKTPCAIAMQGSSIGVDIKMAQYTALLANNKKVDDYEQAIKQYLGPVKYIDFVERYRRNPKPDIYDISRELQRLIDENEPHDPLSEKVNGDTIGFKNYCQFLKYAYDPTSAQNAYDSEKIRIKREQAAYKETNPDRMMSFAKAFAMIMIIIVVVLVALSSVDLSSLTNIFGGG